MVVTNAAIPSSYDTQNLFLVRLALLKFEISQSGKALHEEAVLIRVVDLYKQTFGIDPNAKLGTQDKAICKVWAAKVFKELSEPKIRNIRVIKEA